MADASRFPQGIVINVDDLTSIRPVGTIVRLSTTGAMYVSINGASAAYAPVKSVQLGAITSASSSVGGSAAEVAFDQTVVIAANSLQTGSTLRISAHGNFPTTVGTDTCTIKLQLVSGATTRTIMDLGAVDVADNDIFALDATVTIRTSAGGIVVSGFGATGTAGSANPTIFGTTVSTVGALTTAWTVQLTAQWSTSNANSAILQSLVVDAQ